MTDESPSDHDEHTHVRHPRHFWIGVASADHVAIGRQSGFMQVSHGKSGPLRKIRPGDGVVYYSPSKVYGAKDGLRCFTAIGRVREGEPYPGDMGGGFTPFRRDVDWAQSTPTAILPLLEQLELTRGKTSWGYAFRFGLVKISQNDFAVIAAAMQADLAVD